MLKLLFYLPNPKKVSYIIYRFTCYSSSPFSILLMDTAARFLIQRFILMGMSEVLKQGGRREWEAARMVGNCGVGGVGTKRRRIRTYRTQFLPNATLLRRLTNLRAWGTWKSVCPVSVTAYFVTPSELWINKCKMNYDKQITVLYENDV